MRAKPVIHETAIIDGSAVIASDVEIGPYTIVGADVQIDSGTIVGPHVVLKGPTRIGRNNRIFQFASIGEDPQDLKYQGERSSLVIGDGNTIREAVTIHRGTAQDNSLTQIGNDNLFMAYVHVAHDCVLGNNIILANNATLAGHVVVEDYAILGGFTAVHQFTRLGSHCFTGFATALDRDVLPYFTVAGNRARARGINKEGLARKCFKPETIRALQETYKILVKSRGTLKDKLERASELAKLHAEVQQVIDFLNRSERGWTR
ncbi:MAG: acyl-ACP--UDP-N-acetylglucosamine O-acyltransferase [Gammaproteobacteria bacterium]|nr:acyl-ACP--UDP-N-acetylglucosamine O-acyltransferase [Gammaproteobacteria bacterium]